MSNSVLIKIIISLLIVLAAAVALLLYLDPGKDETQSPPSRAVSGVSIGGAYTLETGDGRTITDQSFPEKLKIVYFGYTFCPDVCRVGLLNISAALDLLGEAADQYQPLFVTIDPTRDTPKIVSEYVDYYDDRIIGLSGSQQAIDQIIKAYRIYVAIPPNQDPENYLVDHSAYIYIMDQDGTFLDVLDHDASPDKIAASFRKYIK